MPGPEVLTAVSVATVLHWHTSSDSFKETSKDCFFRAEGGEQPLRQSMAGIMSGPMAEPTTS